MASRRCKSGVRRPWRSTRPTTPGFPEPLHCTKPLPAPLAIIQTQSEALMALAVDVSQGVGRGCSGGISDGGG